jgi:hypothetical protein
MQNADTDKHAFTPEAPPPLERRVKAKISTTDNDNKRRRELSENIAERQFHRAPIVVPAPNPVVMGKQNPLSDMEQGGEATVNLEVIEKRFTSSSVYITILMQNIGEKGVRRRLFAFGYDKNNRLLSSSNKSLYFQPHEQMIQNYSFSRSYDITRWFFALR